MVHVKDTKSVAMVVRKNNILQLSQVIRELTVAEHGGGSEVSQQLRMEEMILPSEIKCAHKSLKPNRMKIRHYDGTLKAQHF
jgi:hypothetical protein